MNNEDSPSILRSDFTDQNSQPGLSQENESGTLKTMSWQRIWRRRLHQIRSPKAISSRLSRAKLVSRLAFFAFIVFVVMLVFGVGIFAYMAKDLPQPGKIVRQEGFSSKIYDRNGKLLYDVFADERRTPVSIDEIPLYLQEATIAIEDKNFYKHSGFDASGIMRAFYNIVVHQKLQGGSTITQQLVKTVLLTQDRNITRKLKELILTVQIESKYSKKEILQMYLNEIPYGGTAWGVEAASESYYGKKVAELNLVECAILAGLPQSPSRHSPYVEDSDYVARTKEVLRRMQEDGYITQDQENEAVSQLPEFKFSGRGVDFKAPHFVMYVKKQLEDKYGESVVEGGGLKVYTTLDLELQEKAQQIIADEIAKVEAVHITNGASIVLDPSSGEILAMVGSKNYDDPDYDGKVNVTLSLRQPGSTIKPVTYLTALKKGYTASTVLMDVETVFPVTGQPDYKPVNYDGKFHGPMQMRYALGNSINIPAVKTVAIVGIKDMLQTAYDMGLSTLEPSQENLRRLGLSVTLGGGEIRLLELASAYSAFANGGLKVEPVAITKIVDRQDNVIFEQKSVQKKQVITPQQAFIISNILADNDARTLTFGTSSSLYFSNRAIAVKTGTTNDKRDNWTIGWTPQIIAGVWVGNNDNSQMKQLASGISGAAPIWRKIIIEALKDKPNEGFTVPDGIVTQQVDVVSGWAAHDDFPSRTEYFIKGTEPSSDDPIHQKLKLCRGESKLATPVMVAKNDYETKEFFIFKEDDPVSTDGTNRWQAGIDSWLALQTDSRYHPPTDYCGSASDSDVIISEPGNQAQINSNDVKVSGKVISEKEVRKIEIFINDQSKETFENTKKFERVFVLSDGTYKIRVVATNSDNQQKTAEIKIGVNVAWDWQPATPTPTNLPTPTPTPTSVAFHTPTPTGHL